MQGLKSKNNEGTHWEEFVREDNFEAFSTIYNMFVDDLLSYGMSLSFDEETCKDAVQDIFYKLFVEKQKLKHVKNKTAYLFRAFRNHLFNIRKKDSKFLDITFDSVPFFTEITILETLINDEEKEQLKRIVKHLLDELTPRQREAIYLRHMQNMEYEEIADLLEMNPESVRKLVYRGMENLRGKTTDLDNPLYLFLILHIFNNLL